MLGPRLPIVLIHLRLTVPTDLADEVRSLLEDDERVTNLVLHEGASRRPEGDLIEVDVVREAASELLAALDRTGLDERGGILLVEPTGTPFAKARELEKLVPGDPQDAVIWDSVIESAEDGAVPTLSFHLFLVLAVVLAAVAVITDSPVLVVGAMVVGPEFGLVAGASVGLVFGKWRLAGRSLLMMVVAFTVAVGMVALLALLARATGLLTSRMITRPRPQTDFIWNPDEWSLIVALVAGTVGVLALSLEKSSTMVGVFISVTTVPAAGNLALGIALWEVPEITGSLTQLGVNLAGMLVAGTLFLAFQRRWWHTLAGQMEKTFGSAR